MFTRTALVAVALLFAGVAAAQVYKWVDEDGVVHYSDQPVEGAERIDLPKSRTSRPGAGIAPRQSLPDRGQPPAESGSEPFSYESIGFSAPSPEQTLWNIGGTLNVTVSVTPGLRSSDRLRVYFDGAAREVRSTQFQLEEVWRGTHNLQAEILDANGNLMIRSEPMQFYVQQTSVLNP